MAVLGDKHNPPASGNVRGSNMGTAPDEAIVAITGNGAGCGSPPPLLISLFPYDRIGCGG